MVKKAVQSYIYKLTSPLYLVFTFHNIRKMNIIHKYYDKGTEDNRHARDKDQFA